MFDKFGRRPLLLWGGVAMHICHFIVATLGTSTTSQTASGVIIVLNVAAQKASITFVCLFIAFFAATWGPLAWVVTAELYPLKHRSQMLSISTATNVSCSSQCRHFEIRAVRVRFKSPPQNPKSLFFFAPSLLITHQKHVPSFSTPDSVCCHDILEVRWRIEENFSSLYPLPLFLSVDE